MNEMVQFVRQRFAALANPSKAVEMAAYMKTDMRFYGVQTPQRVPVQRELKEQFPITTHVQYKRAVLALWNAGGQPHREEKYAALFIAGAYEKFITLASLPLYRRLIVEGAWWDFVDGIAANMVGRVVLRQRREASQIMARWVKDENMWIRRSAILCQIKHKQETDERLLFDFCLLCAHEREFFIRKAIGWALREYAKTAPKRVASYLRKHRDKLSNLSFREASKHLAM